MPGHVRSADPLGHPLRRRLARFGRVIRSVLGVPDYAAYVAHLQQYHPGTVPMPEREFAQRRLEERYARPGSRCC